ncbi:16609_t:CDS:1, partial [Funneliformis mosseae]
MPSKKYRTYYLKKEKVDAIQEIKENIIALEHDVTKIHQNLKRIGREICYLYNAMIKSSESSSSESE